MDEKNIKDCINETIQRTQIIKDNLEKNKTKYIQACTFILYQETTSYDCKKVIESIINLCNQKNYKYSYIYHNQDIITELSYEDFNLIGNIGELKKPHYHFVLCFGKQIDYNGFVNTLNPLCNDDFFKNNIRELKPKNIDSALLYLTHSAYKDRNKYQYNVEEIISNITDYNIYLYNKAKEQKPLLTLIDILISNNDNTIKYISAIKYLQSNDFDDNTINKYWRIIKDLIDEHNRLYDNLKYIKGKNDIEITKKYAQIEKENSIITNLCDTFDKISVEDGDTKKEIMLINRRKNKK